MLVRRCDSTMRASALALATLLLRASAPAYALKCYATSYDIKNWKPCSAYKFGASRWLDRCDRGGALTSELTVGAMLVHAGALCKRVNAVTQ